DPPVRGRHPPRGHHRLRHVLGARGGGARRYPERGVLVVGRKRPDLPADGAVDEQSSAVRRRIEAGRPEAVNLHPGPCVVPGVV
ncbi:unnamed protein product, partial [Ectocarpus sp. 8 AP-2014]